MRQSTREKLIIYSNDKIRLQIVNDIMKNVPIFADLEDILKGADDAFENTKKEIKSNKRYIEDNIFGSKNIRRTSNPNNKKEYTDVFPELRLNVKTIVGEITVMLPIYYNNVDPNDVGDLAESDKRKIDIAINARDYNTLVKKFNARYPLFVHEFIHVYFGEKPSLNKRLFKKLERLLKIDNTSTLNKVIVNMRYKNYYGGVEETITQFVDLIILEGFDYIDKPTIRMIPEIYKRYKRTKGHRPNYIQTVALAIMLTKYRRQVKEIISKYRSL